MTFDSFDEAYRAAVKPGPDRLLSGVALGAAGALRKGKDWFIHVCFC